LLFLAGAAGAGAQFSPGPLSRAHEPLSGPTHCMECHTVAGGARRFKCLDCHTEIRQRLAEGRGMHPALVKKQRNDCSRCHSEHNGEQFALTHWEVALPEFDHRQAGFPLEGRHAALSCSRCHNPDHIRKRERENIILKDLRRTYLGLSGDCVSCHKDKLRNQTLAGLRPVVVPGGQTR